MRFTPPEGRVWNPLRKHRNLPCPCGSGSKVKRCHGAMDTLLIEDAEKAKQYLLALSKYGFIKPKKAYET